MYSNLLTIHSLVRWLVIVSGLAAAILVLLAPGRANTARSGANAGAATASLLFTIAFDVQIVIGLLLYLRFSPTTTTAIHHMGAAMSNSVLRFWAVEHPVGMLLALALAHLARVRLARAGSDARRLRSAGLVLAIAVVVVIVSAPWPFLPYGRPLL